MVLSVSYEPKLPSVYVYIVEWGIMQQLNIMEGPKKPKENKGLAEGARYSSATEHYLPSFWLASQMRSKCSGVFAN